MPIHAMALIRGTRAPDGLASEVLDDAVLVRTPIRFDLEPDELASALVARLGDAFGDDGRGVFVVPDVAFDEARAHRSYDAVVDAIGEAGMWVRKPTLVTEGNDDRALGVDDLLAQAMAGRPISPAALAAVLGMPGADGEEDETDEDDDTAATATDMPFDLGALLASPELRGVIERLAGTIASSPETQRELEGAAARGLDLEALAQSPAIEQLMQGFAEELGRNPAALSALLAGGMPGSDDDE